jgi:hypothetical protein
MQWNRSALQYLMLYIARSSAFAFALPSNPHILEYGGASLHSATRERMQGVSYAALAKRMSSLTLTPGTRVCARVAKDADPRPRSIRDGAAVSACLSARA